MMGEVVTLEVQTSLPISLRRVVGGALKAKLSPCIVIGETEAGKLHFAFTHCDAGELLLLLERARRVLMKEVENGP